ncbi:MAG: pentapeptide repeat-containing protein [Candidatus Thiodiazotropha taylori]|nr:pentapeptide repeat-containing protein [Candidatus Thiodiazotropha taylori]MCG8051924.1 pentapeptide repeat-containing protein [Candidatus Thiodiazotropha taylori]MCG8109562.1 pentapeptide repeat-containing protein [Candidatus Thiodiazotropha taylori]MCW4281906.1 pentapeptide repeat-containing protein [Candidatus Thiodiazotropha taylori]MCW4306092.1 pentapeptide repeat-containing protein [Candidatus Thiodiazotropha taylori]
MIQAASRAKSPLKTHYHHEFQNVWDIKDQFNERQEDLRHSKCVGLGFSSEDRHRPIALKGDYQYRPDLSFSNFTQAQFGACRLKHIKLQRSLFQEAVFRRMSRFNLVDFSSSFFLDVKLCGRFIQCVFDRSWFVNKQAQHEAPAIFGVENEVVMSAPRFKQCHFDKTRFENIALRWVKFERCTFRAGIFKNVKMDHVKFEGCTFEGNRYEDVTLVECKRRRDDTDPVIDFTCDQLGEAVDGLGGFRSELS